MKKPIIGLFPVLITCFVTLVVLHSIVLFKAEMYFLNRPDPVINVPFSLFMVFLGCPGLTFFSFLLSVFIGDRLFYAALPENHPKRAALHYSFISLAKDSFWINMK